MGKYPLIEKMGLRIDQMWPVNTVTYSGNIGYSVIRADDLEDALEKATVVYKHPGQAFKDDWCSQGDGATHQALLICVESIKKEPVKVEVICLKGDEYSSVYVPKEFKGRHFKATFEEYFP